MYVHLTAFYHTLVSHTGPALCCDERLCVCSVTHCSGLVLLNQRLVHPPILFHSLTGLLCIHSISQIKYYTHNNEKRRSAKPSYANKKNATQQESIAKREIKELKRKTSVALVFFRAKIFTPKKVSASDQNVGKIANNQSWYPENHLLSHS